MKPCSHSHKTPVFPSYVVKVEHQNAFSSSSIKYFRTMWGYKEKKSNIQTKFGQIISQDPLEPQLWWVRLPVCWWVSCHCQHPMTFSMTGRSSCGNTAYIMDGSQRLPKLWLLPPCSAFYYSSSRLYTTKCFAHDPVAYWQYPQSHAEKTLILCAVKQLRLCQTLWTEEEIDKKLKPPGASVPQLRPQESAGLSSVQDIQALPAWKAARHWEDWQDVSYTTQPCIASWRC